MRFGIVDLFAAVALLLAVFLPAPSRGVRPFYGREQEALVVELAEAQAAVTRDPKDGAAAARLADVLARAHQTDWALRTGAVGAAAGSPSAWRAAVAVSAAYMGEREVAAATSWAGKAIGLCDGAAAGGCSDDDRVRLAMYATALRSVAAAGLDVKKSSKGISEAVERAVPLIRLGKKP